ncbi:ThiF family adenylyltransferase [Rhodanobacter soli]
MMPRATLSLSATVKDQLRAHLFPGDHKEAAAVLVCARVPGQRLRLIARDVVLVPHNACASRTEHSLTWPGAHIEEAIDIAAPEQLSLILVHSHPYGFPDFSDTDDASDQEVMPCIFEAVGDLHGSAIMLPSGVLLARLYDPHGDLSLVDLVSVVGDDLQFWWRDDLSGAAIRPMAFTSDMRGELSRLTACVIGISGTGSPVAEQACRLGFGRVIGIDHDHVEDKNLNRILNTSLADARGRRTKVAAFGERVNQYRETSFFEDIDANVMTRKAVLAAAQADVVFCCVDTHRGRMIADRIAACFLLPLFDVGVAIPTRKTGDGLAIAEVTGRIDYVKPGGSSLGDRGVYTAASLQAEALAESDPGAHAEQVKAGYIEGLPEQAPAVISLNLRAASACMLEFIARAYPFRHEPNARYARTRFMLAEAFEEFTAESEFPANPSALLADGAKEPLLGLPVLGQEDTGCV